MAPTPHPIKRLQPMKKLLLFLLLITYPLNALLLIPMDDSQTDHLKAYGVVYKMLKNNIRVYWLLNYRGGSFAAEATGRESEMLAREAGVKAQAVSGGEWAAIVETIKNSNMEKITLEKAPKIAVYTPPEKLP